MIIPIPTLDLSTLTTSSPPALVQLNQTAPYFSLDQEKHKPYWLVFHNESGSLLQINLSTSGGKGFRLPAGAWRILTLLDYVDSFTVQVLNVLPNPPIQLLIVDFYSSDEVAPTPESLGNSPIGLSAVSLPVTQVIQDGQAVGQTLVESTPTGQGQSTLMTTDGKLALSPKLGGAQKTLLTLATSDTNAAYLFIVDTSGELLIQVFPSTKVYKLDNSGSLTVPGTLLSVGGQASAGSFGTPVIVAQAINVNVTVTTDQTILSFTPPATGLYRVSLWAEVHGTNNGNNVARVVYTDGNQFNIFSQFFFGSQNNQAPAVVNALAITKDQPFYTAAETIYASSTAAIVVHWQNSAAGTINDFVTALIERLA